MVLEIESLIIGKMASPDHEHELSNSEIGDTSGIRTMPYWTNADFKNLFGVSSQFQNKHELLAQRNVLLLLSTSNYAMVN